MTTKNSLCRICGDFYPAQEFEIGPDVCRWCDVVIRDRLDYLREEIRAERISYEEIAELQTLSEYIKDDDVELLEWAGVPEGSRDEKN
jgi:hypothetical protein